MAKSARQLLILVVFLLMAASQALAQDVTPQPGKWEGESPEVSFEVLADGSIANFEMNVYWGIGYCLLEIDHIAVAADGSFSFENTGTNNAGKRMASQGVYGQFTSPTSVAGSWLVIICGSQGGLYFGDTNWSATKAGSVEPDAPVPTLEPTQPPAPQIAPVPTDEPGALMVNTVIELVEEGVLSEFTGNVAAYHESTTITINNKENWYEWRSFDGLYSNFVMSATIKWGKGPEDNYCGFLFRQFNDTNMYMVNMDRQGYLWFQELANGNWQDSLLGDASYVNTKQDETNELTIVAVKDAFTVYVNGEYAGQFQDTTLPSGSTGVLGGVNAKVDRAGCTFRKFWVWNLNAPTRQLPTLEPTAIPPTAVVVTPNADTPTYSEVIATYPPGTELSYTDIKVTKIEADGAWTFTDGVIRALGRMTVKPGTTFTYDVQNYMYYGAKFTLLNDITIDGITYPAGTMLTLDKDLNWIVVSGWD